MLSAGELYEFEFKNESLAVKTYQAVLDANPSNLDALEKLESLGAAFTVATAWKRLPGTGEAARNKRRTSACNVLS